MSNPAASALSGPVLSAPASLRIAQGRDIRRNGLQWLVFMLLRGAILVVAAALVIIVGFLVKNGISAISWSFLTEVPRNNMTEGGVLPCIVGTLLLSLGAMAVALPLGVASAIYLHEYARPGTLMRIIRLGVNNLAGVPSVVFGLFGLGLFVTAMQLGVSLLAGWLTLGVLCLPVVIGTAEEALRGVPSTYREASLALGGTKWQTIWRVVLPSALPGILTGSILGVGRAAGETGPSCSRRRCSTRPRCPRASSRTSWPCRTTSTCWPRRARRSRRRGPSSTARRLCSSPWCWA